MKKVYKASLSFSKSELQRSIVKLGGVGINMRLSEDEPIRKKQLEKIKEDLNKSKDSFGLFGGSSDANKFYPGLNASSIIPKDEDYVKVPFRLLSATVVAGHSWRATDFSDLKVLKGSVNKLDKKPVFTEHDQDVMNHVGLVQKPRWADSYVDKAGNKIPAGIDGDIWIDALTSPKIARSVLSGGIFSESVTVEFEWEKSHKIDDDEIYFNKIGTFGEDGRMITRKATNIIDYHESSLVWLGADPFAKKHTDDGELLHPEWGSVVEFSKEGEDVRNNYQKNKKYFAGSCISKTEAISLTKNYDFGLSKEATKDTETEMNKELLAFLLTFLAVDSEDKINIDAFKKLSLLKDGQIAVENDELTTLRAANTKLTELEPKLTDALGKLTALETDKVTLTTKVAELTPKAVLGDKFVNLKRDEVKRLYSLSVENKVDPALIAIFDRANEVELEAFLGQYTKGAKEMFKAKCKQCGSEELSFRSSVSEGEGDDGKTKVQITEESVSYDAIYKKFSKNSN